MELTEQEMFDKGLNPELDPKISGRELQINGKVFEEKYGHIIDLNALPKDAVVVDCGLCRGQWIEWLDYNTDVKDFRIIGFEPSKNNLENMRRRNDGNVGNYSPDAWPNHLNIEVDSRAIVGMGESEVVTFYEFNGLPTWGNVLGTKLERGFNRRTEDSPEYEVNTVTLESIFNEFNLSVIDYLKLDVEGAEVGIIKTMTEEIAMKINQISMEVHESWDYEPLKNCLDDLGFDTFYVENELYGY